MSTIFLSRKVLAAISSFMLFTLLSWNSPHAADYYNGGEIYREHCANCHGSTGRGEFPGTPDFTRGESINKPENQLIRHLQFGSGASPAFRNILTEQEMLDVIAYIRGLY